MRRVEYYVWRKKENGIGQEKHLAGFGDFHQFGCDFEETTEGAGTYSTAIIELADGTIVNPPVEMVKFMDKG